MENRVKKTKNELFDEAQNNVCRATIFAVGEKKYGVDYKKHFFEQYKIYVDSVNYTSDMKLKVNTYFLTANTALFTAIGIGLSRQELNPSVWHFMLPLAGILLSIVWWAVTYSYKKRNVAKLRVIHCLEELLPLALYKTEWELMDEIHNGSIKKYFFNVDLFTPFVFVIYYLLFICLV